MRRSKLAKAGNMGWNGKSLRRQRTSKATEKERQKVLSESLIRISGGTDFLSVTGALLGDAGIKRLADALLQSKNVRWLQLDDNRIGNAGAGHLARVLSANTSLRVLDLDFNVIKDDGAAWLASALLTNNTLQELDLHYNSIGSAGVLRLAETLEVNSTLQTLSLHGNTVGDAGAARLSQALQKNATLRVLHLGSAGIGDDGAADLAEALETNRGLWALHLEENQIGDIGATCLAKVVLLNPVLGELWLLKNKIGEVGARELSKCLRKPANLRRLGLTISHVSDMQKKEILTAFNKRHVLRRAARNLSAGISRLDLDDQKLGDDGVKELSDSITANCNLKELHLKKNGISDRGIGELVRAVLTCSNLVLISLASNEIGNDGASTLASVLGMAKASVAELDSAEAPKVKVLDLEFNRIGDEGAIRLAEALEKNISLEKLTLHGNAIGDAAASRLFLARENSPCLRELSINLPSASESPSQKSSALVEAVALGVKPRTLHEKSSWPRQTQQPTGTSLPRHSGDENNASEAIMALGKVAVSLPAPPTSDRFGLPDDAADAASEIESIPAAKRNGVSMWDVPDDAASEIESVPVTGRNVVELGPADNAKPSLFAVPNNFTNGKENRPRHGDKGTGLTVMEDKHGLTIVDRLDSESTVRPSEFGLPEDVGVGIETLPKSAQSKFASSSAAPARSSGEEFSTAREPQVFDLDDNAFVEPEFQGFEEEAAATRGSADVGAGVGDILETQENPAAEENASAQEPTPEPSEHSEYLKFQDQSTRDDEHSSLPSLETISNAAASHALPAEEDYELDHGLNSSQDPFASAFSPEFQDAMRWEPSASVGSANAADRNAPLHSAASTSDILCRMQL